LRTTCVATRIEGGHADNALPMRAKATVNCRLLPDEDEALVRSQIERAAGERVKVRAKNELARSPGTDPAAPPMAVIEREARATWPGVTVMPVMSAGATDGSRLRNAGIPVYGVLPIFMGPDDWTRMHAKDERIPAAAFAAGLAYVDRLVRALAAGP
jgi:acetylornithine deacetylase/succinyl-diaminopimelate desuccinylase-like protein